MSTSPLLTQSDMEQSRTPAELFAWVEAKCEQLGATPEAKRFARSGDHLVQKFYDEVRPLALFAWREFGARQDILVTPNLNNDNFDGVVALPGCPKLFVEVTYAKNGYKDSLRMEVLTREGHVNALAPITVTGTRHSPNRRIKIPNEAVNHDSTVAEHLGYVENRLKAKANASYGLSHVLVVVVDDYIPFRDSSDVKKLEHLVKGLLSCLLLNIGRLVVLGESGGLFLSYDVQPPAT